LPKSPKKDDIDTTLRKKGLDPTISYIVRKKVTYVPCDDLQGMEVYQFLSSISMLFGGIFLGVITTTNPINPNFILYSIIGLILIIVGIGLFYFGVHKRLGKWEKEKKKISKVR